ncbi:hypothetical protein J7F03_38245 [Streptomyces sp. ISL-43]|uniref:hypothetical protein n=1 Tax=Streptomyces sp. ISL-43 TaxID=2819183 RepID=UPI001BE80F7B|nr:hypothetical protein [Streptomyces sp. ISL-43]MBT2452776.1 hypothetical protein [Streptomyces sp. ISL-43]
MHQKRSYGRMLLVSVLVGCLEVALAVVVVLLYVRTRPPPDTPVDHAALVAGLLSFGVIVGVIAFLLSLVSCCRRWRWPTCSAAGSAAARRGGGCR